MRLLKNSGTDRVLDELRRSLAPQGTFVLPSSRPDGTEVYPVAPAGYESRWICGQERYHQLQAEGLIEWVHVAKNGSHVWQVYQKFYLEGRLKQPSNLWSDLEGNKKATRDLKALFDGQKVFSFPKPVELTRHIIQLAGGDKDALIVDFVAGSGTTGHGVMAENAADRGSRRYILVQLPEPLDAGIRDQKSAADFCDKLGRPRQIAELTKERLRRASQAIKKETPMFAGDIGFRVFKLAFSNIRAWEPDPANLGETLQKSIEHLDPNRTEADILFELLLKLGLDLTVPIEEKAIAGKTVHSIGAGTLLVCLAPEIAAAEVEPLALGIAAWHKTLAPAGDTTVVFRDSAFADDVAKSNLTAILQQHGLENVRSL